MTREEYREHAKLLFTDAFVETRSFPELLKDVAVISFTKGFTETSRYLGKLVEPLVKETRRRLIQLQDTGVTDE